MKENQFILRLMTKEDIVPVFELYKKVWLSTYVSKENNILEKDIVDFWSTKLPYQSDEVISNEDVLRLVVTYKDLIVATSNTFRKSKDLSLLYINTLYIDPSFQRKGIGCMMINHIKNYFKNYSNIFLETATYNNKAIDFYIKNGFSIDSNWKGNFSLGNGKSLPLIKLTYNIK